MTARFGLVFVVVALAVGAVAVGAAGGTAVTESGSSPVTDAPSQAPGAELPVSTVSAGPSATVAAAGQESVDGLSGLQEPPETDATVTRIRVQPNGTVEWSLTIRMELDSEAAETAFEAFSEEFETNRSAYVDAYRDRMTDVVSNAEAVTEREMTATAFEGEVGTEAVPRQWGFVTYRFRWDGFAPVENGAVLVGDVFEGGLFLQEDDILVIHAPDGYAVADVEPSPDGIKNGELRWDGPKSFDDGRPQAAFAPADSGVDDGTGGDADESADDGTADPPEGNDDAADDGTGDLPNGNGDPADDGTGDASDENDDGGFPLSGAMLLGTVGTVALLGLLVLYVRGQRRERESDTPTTGDDSGASAEEVPKLATDEDRVVATLEAADGRLRQAELADRLDWSPSKTSRVLSDMADDGRIEKLRVGRENVIDLDESEAETGD